MRVLVTGARLPASLEIARALSSRGIEVFTADTVHFGFAVVSKAAQKYVRFPSPVLDYEGFRRAIVGAVKDYGIDLVIPVSEEIFFLSQFADEIPLFAPPHSVLRDLHSKLGFQKYGSPTALTKIVRSREELDEASRSFGEIVVKQEFSRGAIGTLIRPSSSDFEKVRFPAVVQKFIQGPEICSYSIAREGDVVAHAAYEPRYRYGHGASVYFRSVDGRDSLELVRAAVSKLNLTGQIAFDFIQSADGLVAIECNPRATSGIHLLSSDQIAEAFLGMTKETALAPASLSRAAKITLLMTNFVSPKDFFAAKDTAFRWSDPFPFLSQFVSVFELAYRAKKWKMNPGDAFGYDIEWNGEPFE